MEELSSPDHLDLLEQVIGKYAVEMLSIARTAIQGEALLVLWSFPGPILCP